MPRNSFSIILLLSGTLTLAYAFCTGSNRIPAKRFECASIFYVESSLIDLGTIEQFKKYKASTKIFNLTEDTISIVEVAKSCSCSDLLIESKILKPGESTLMHLSWSTGNSKGRKTEVLTLFCEDQHQPTRAFSREIRLTGIIEADFSLSHDELRFDPAVESEQTISLKDRAGMNTIITSVSSPSPFFSFRMSEKNKSFIVLTHPERCGAISSRSEIMISTSHLADQRIILPVYFSTSPGQKGAP
jgi:hypothetical protein